MPKTAAFSLSFTGKTSNVISGFNTDVEFGGVVYHVQTEDKGQKSRLLLTLVYDRGTILASKRVKYEDLTEADLQPDALAERLQRQHQLICAAVKAGRLNDLQSMTARDRQAAQKTVPTSAPAPVPVVPAPTVSAEVPKVQVAVAEAPAAVPVVPAALPIVPMPSIPVSPADDEIEMIPVYEIFDDGPLIEGATIIDEDDDEILPIEAVEVVGDLTGTSRPTNTKLSVELLTDSKFKGGDRKTISVMICRGSERKVIGDAEIMVKVLGSSFRPVIFHARSDVNGLAKVHLQLPQFEAGRAALLIRARSNGDEAELRKIVMPG